MTAPASTLTSHLDPAGRAGADGARPRTLGEMILATSEAHRGVALHSLGSGHPAYISYRELATVATEIARGLISLGIAVDDRVAILGETSALWTLADCGVLCAGAVVTPIYHTNSPVECAYVLAHSGARLVFCEDAEQVAKIAAVRGECPELAHVIVLEGTAPGARTLEELRNLGAEVPPDAVTERLARVGPQDMATLVYTSGTTGPPKACMLTHENVLATVRAYCDVLHFHAGHSVYQFLPLAHVLARVVQFSALTVGARIIFWSGDPARITDELASAAPTHFPAVPRVYEKLHAAIVGRSGKASAPERALFSWALGCGMRARTAVRERRLPGLAADLQYRIAERLVLQRVRSLFGPNLELAMVGAAPVAPEILSFFDACGVLVLEGYGLSESCAASTVNTVDAVRFGTVGRPLPGTEVRIAEDGEVQLHGPNVFRGYLHDPDATADAITEDGWLRTGDLGSLSEDGFLSITGRKKDLIITSSGKNVSPATIEKELREGRLISEAVVYGDKRPYLVALLTLDHDEVTALLPENGASGDLTADPRVRAAVRREVDAVNARLARVEQIKRFDILEGDLTQASGELTPTLKVRRDTVNARYAERFDRLYEQGEQR